MIRTWGDVIQNLKKAMKLEAECQNRRSLKFIKIHHMKQGERFYSPALISFGFIDRGSVWRQFYIQFQSPEKIWETYTDFMMNREVTGWRRKTFRIILRWNSDKMTDE